MDNTRLSSIPRVHAGFVGDPGFHGAGRTGIRRQRTRSLRVKGRRISNWWANLETLWAGIDDSLFGFRVYPIEP